MLLCIIHLVYNIWQQSATAHFACSLSHGYSNCLLLPFYHHSATYEHSYSCALWICVKMSLDIYSGENHIHKRSCSPEWLSQCLRVTISFPALYPIATTKSSFNFCQVLFSLCLVSFNQYNGFKIQSRYRVLSVVCFFLLCSIPFMNSPQFVYTVNLLMDILYTLQRLCL